MNKFFSRINCNILSFLLVTVVFLVNSSKDAFAQDTISRVLSADTTVREEVIPVKKQEKFVIKGYFKYLLTTSFANNADSLVTNNLIHNRLNFRWSPTASITAGIEVRNRLFFGEQVKMVPQFGEIINRNNGYIKMSALVVNDKALVIHSIIDRAWVNWRNKKWDIRLGRQRINWGINSVWNPNDIFNSYNFLDFDYEERPGTDALRVQYFTGSLSNIEFAIKPGKENNETVAALKYNFNKHGYDIQLLGGVFYDDIMVGTGWAGNIKDAGFKGEVSYFHPANNIRDTSGVVSIAASVDYSFSKGIYVNGSLLYNSAVKATSSILDFSGRNLSPKSLMPFKYSLLGQISYNFTPILSGSLTTIYSPDVNAFILVPSANYSIVENWDIDLVGQFFHINKFQYNSNNIYLRLKRSF